MLDGMKFRPSPLTFEILSVLFFVLGFISSVGVIAHWHFDHTIPWLFVAYAAMNILLGVGFWSRERWLLTAVALNCIGYTALYVGAWVMGGDVDITAVAVSTAVAGSIWGLVYLHRRHLVGSPAGIVSTSFFLIWLLTYSYSFANTF